MKTHPIRATVLRDASLRHGAAEAYRHPRSGFTLIETVLAVVIGGMVLLGCVSVFLASARAEKAYSQRFDRTGELWTTQLAVRRTFLSLLMDEQSAAAPTGTGVESTEDFVRPRVILEPDVGAPEGPGGSRPQRLEVTVARSPVPSIVGSQIGAWLVEQDRADSLDFASTNLSSGAIRGVYELRPSGTREAIMMNLGIMDMDRKLMQRMESDPPPGWTLWWRPILSTELAELEAGVPPRGDLSGNVETVQNRLAGAIPVLRGVDTLRWTIFKSDQRIQTYAGGTIVDLPAFAELEVLLINGQYANWMFEIGWETGSDPTGSAGEDDTDTPDADNAGNGGNAGGGRPGGDRPGTGNGGGGIRNPGNTTGDLGNRNDR